MSHWVDPRDLQRAAYVEYSILTLVVEKIRACVNEAPSLSAAELLERFQTAAREQLAEYQSLRAVEYTD